MVWVESTKNNKIDIGTIDMFSFSKQYHGNWKDVKKHIKIEL